MAFTIDIQDRATPAVAGALSELQLAGVKPAIGRAVARLVQQHFLRLNRSRANPLGGTRTNFYAQAARHTRFQVTSGGVRLTVDQVGIRQRLQGGQILPRHAAYLTLPAIAQAYGRRAPADPPPRAPAAKSFSGSSNPSRRNPIRACCPPTRR